MTSFEGFKKGCPAEASFQQTKWTSLFAYFVDADGQQIDARAAGLVQPAAVRIEPYSESGEPFWTDRQYSFGEALPAAPASAEGRQIQNTQLTVGQLATLNGICERCDARGEDCPVLIEIIAISLESGT